MPSTARTPPLKSLDEALDLDAVVARGRVLAHREKVIAAPAALPCAPGSRLPPARGRCPLTLQPHASRLKVMPFVEVGDEPGLGWLPAEQLAGQRAGGRRVEPEEAAEPGEVLGRVLGGDGDDRELEMPSDDLGDVADRHALLGDRVQRRSRRGLFEPETEEARRIEPVHGGPAVAAVADVAGDALLAGDADQGRDEAVVPVAVIRRGKASRPTSGRPGRRARA